MKKLFFLCAFLFMSMQIQAQLYIVSVESPGSAHVANPDGTGEYVSFPSTSGNHFNGVNTILNDIISEGYKLIHIAYNPAPYGGAQGAASTDNMSLENAVYYLAVP